MAFNDDHLIWSQRVLPAARLWGLALLLFCLGIGQTLMAQLRLNRPAPKYFQGSEPDQLVGRKILESMRNLAPDGGYFMEFQLRVLPRRGDGAVVSGRLWGSQTPTGSLTRMVLDSAADRPEIRLLVRGGKTPAAWRWIADPSSPAAVELDEAALFAPLAGTDLSAFELQMPFLHWADFVYEGRTRLLDRPVETFLLYPPEGIARHRPDLAGIRVYLDPNYHALVQAEQIGGDGRVLKSFRVQSLARIGDRYLVRTVELRDERTRNKTRFVVRAAALGQDFSASVFTPASLAGLVNVPSSLTRFED